MSLEASEPGLGSPHGRNPGFRLRLSQATNLLTMSNSTCFFVPAARFLRPGFETLASLPRLKGWRSAESRRVLARHPLGLHVTRQARRLSRRLASHDAGRPPPGALTVAIWAPVPRFPHRNCF